jgi:hypothetical protein
VGGSDRFPVEYLAAPDVELPGAGSIGTVLAIVNPGKHRDAPIMLAPNSLAIGLVPRRPQPLTLELNRSVVVVPPNGPRETPLVIVADPNDHVPTTCLLPNTLAREIEDTVKGVRSEGRSTDA